MFKVIGTDTYLEEIGKWTKSDRVIAEKIPHQIAINHYSGSPLGYRFLREKRVKEKRVYYLVYRKIFWIIVELKLQIQKNQNIQICYQLNMLIVYCIFA